MEFIYVRSDKKDNILKRDFEKYDIDDLQDENTNSDDFIIKLGKYEFD